MQKKQLSPFKGIFEDDVPFSTMGYFSFLKDHVLTAKLGLRNPPKNRKFDFPKSLWQLNGAKNPTGCPTSTWINFKCRYPKQITVDRIFFHVVATSKMNVAIINPHFRCFRLVTIFFPKVAEFLTWRITMKRTKKHLTRSACTVPCTPNHINKHIFSNFSSKGQFIVADLQFHLPTFKVHTSNGHWWVFVDHPSNSSYRFDGWNSESPAKHLRFLLPYQLARNRWISAASTLWIS